MKRVMVVGVLSLISFAWLATASVRAAEEGQADLDKATELKLEAQSLSDLEKVAQLCESALRKGLNKGNEDFAKQLLTSTLYQHAAKLASAIFDQQPPDPRWPLLRQAALPLLERALKHDAKLEEVHYLIARLESLPGGDQARALKAVGEAVRLSKDDNQELSKALLLRGDLNDDDDKKLADYNQAIIIDPNNADAWKTRGLFHLGKGNHEQAATDFAKILEGDAKNLTAHHAIAEALTYLEKYDQALEHINKAIELQPDQPLAYTLRARIRAIQGDLKAAQADLDAALKAAPNDVAALLMRARLHQAQGETEKARKDVDRALVVRPGLVQGILLRSMVAAAAGDWDRAIADMKDLLNTDPKNGEWRLQLAAYYSGSQRPRRAIAIYSEILDEEPENWLALRARADTLLSVGKHAEAIADFEVVLKAEPDNSGALNNLAWVLATSPDDKLRNGKRSIELGTRACEVTQYKLPHILSTLASGYAEIGDFETAIKWSTKAVELGGDKEIKEQLQKELDSYKEKKPWRELQEVKEKPEPGPRGGAFEL
jgi:tetratricopeptide (TPR) repeat protein